MEDRWREGMEVKLAGKEEEGKGGREEAREEREMVMLGLMV